MDTYCDRSATRELLVDWLWEEKLQDQLQGLCPNSWRVRAGVPCSEWAREWG